MKRRLAYVKNIHHLVSAYEGLAARDIAEGIGLVHGFTGAGKTTAIAWLVSRERGIYVRANACWTPHAMMEAITRELGLAPKRRTAVMLDLIVERMVEEDRSLFVDEADYLLSNYRMIESLRDIHDRSGMPVVIVGMEGIERRILSRKQLAGRISRAVQFERADLADARVLADTVCDVRIEDDLLGLVHERARGSMRHMTVALAHIERFAKAQDLPTVDAQCWGGRTLFVGADRAV